MIARTIRTAFQAPLITSLLIAAGATIGAVWLQDLRRDVFPDLSAPVFNVIVQNPAMAPEELESSIAVPLEAAIAGVPQVRRVRSSSQLGVVQLTVEFEPEADYYRSRQLVAERVAQVAPAHFAHGAPDCRALISRFEHLRGAGAADLLAPA